MNKDDFKHGDEVTCYIEGQIIKDAKISIDPDGKMFICQNKKDGYYTRDKLGYRYSWNIYKTNDAGSFEDQLNMEDIQVTKLQKVVQLLKIEDDISISEIDTISVSLIKKGASRI